MPCHDDPASGAAVAPLIRPSYFFGQVLGVSDLRDEQGYHMQAHRRHDLALHGWGVIDGLAVEVSTAADVVEVTPGSAVDPCGREIVVPISVSVQLGPPAAPAQSLEDLEVVLRYVERDVAYEPTIGATDGAAEPGQPSRIEEAYEVDTQPVGAASPVDGIVLGRIRRSAGGLAVVDGPSRTEVVTGERLLAMVDDLQARIAALEAQLDIT